MRQKNYLTLEKAFANLEDVAYPDDKRIKMLAFILKEIAIKVGCFERKNYEKENN